MKRGRDSRRRFLQKTALGVAGTALGLELVPGVLDSWTARAEHDSSALNAHELLTLSAMATRIIPADDTPGALEAGVVGYIDAKIKAKKPLLLLYQKGLRETDTSSQKSFRRRFYSLDQNQQTKVLKALETSDFFQQVRRDTIEGFCRSKIGQRVMGYPGSAQPHGYDPTTPPKSPKRRIA